MASRLVGILVPGIDDPGIDLKARKQAPFVEVFTLILLTVFLLLVPISLASDGWKPSLYTGSLAALAAHDCGAPPQLRGRALPHALPRRGVASLSPLSLHGGDDRLLASVSAVQESSKEIGSFVSTVQDIVSRTSLLSMNASIEAGRVGEVLSHVEGQKRLFERIEGGA